MSLSCPYFKEGTFGICVAPDAIHVPSIKEMENFCFRKWYGTCPNLTCKTYPANVEIPLGGKNNSVQGI